MRVSALVLLSVLVSACGTTAPVTTSRSLPRDFRDVDPSPIPRPQTPAEAAILVAEAVDLLQKNDAGALPRLEALLRCDFLTERGRANLYWLAAEAARDFDDARHRDHLAGYLVASSVLVPDAEILDRTSRARAALLADKVQSAQLGVSPARAIVVDNAGEADLVVAQLGCGARGRSPYIERQALVTTAQDAVDDAPAPRRLLCTENGDELVLWFQIAN